MPLWWVMALIDPLYLLCCCLYINLVHWLSMARRLQEQAACLLQQSVCSSCSVS